MKFRRIYWVTEQFDEKGGSQVAGVYTSIPDLIDKGLRWDEGTPGRAGFRITLVKLDSMKSPLGTWHGPEFAGLDESLKEYIGTGEFNEGDCIQLVDAVRSFGG
jgi:hypothetical protein